MKLIPRAIGPQVRQRLAAQPAVVLLGPRQVGKTTLARQIADERNGAAIYLDLERPADLRRLDDADAYLRAQQGRLVVIDEIHRAPGLFAVLRGSSTTIAAPAIAPDSSCSWAPPPST
ncbi:MAG: AAA family ATPase [Hyphomicrobiaceae bacterium]